MKNLVMIASLSFIVGGCTTTPEVIPEPVLDFQSSKSCESNIDMSQAVGLPQDEKAVKRMMRNRTINLTHVMSEESLCLYKDNGESSPYVLFEIPKGIVGQVITAGSKIDVNSMFAAKVIVLDQDGNFNRGFEPGDYKKFGSRFGVQFQPRPDDAFVLIKADESLVGEAEATKETNSATVYVSGAYGYGGNDIRGYTQDFYRTYSYDGEVGLRIVFPKQAED